MLAQPVKTRNTLILLAGLVLGGFVLVQYFVHRGVQSRIGPEHIYNLSEQPKHLTEELALAKALETLAREGFGTEWQPALDGRTSAPDGRADEFASRNTIHPNRVTFLLTNGSGAARFVSVELVTSQVVCRASIPK